MACHCGCQVTWQATSLILSRQCSAVQTGPICDDELAEQLVKPLREGCRLHCFVDACKGVFALGLPSCTYTRADGWSSWEVRSHCLIALLPLDVPFCDRLGKQRADPSPTEALQGTNA